MSGPTTTPFPTTSNAYRQSNAGSTDVFVSKLNATGSTLLYSTYLGGSADDHGYGIAADAAGAVYVTGATGAAFPSTTTSLEHVMGGGTDAFVLRLLTVAGPGLTWNTSLSALPQALSRPAVAVGPDGALYAFGGTDGQNHDYASTYIYHPITDTWTVGASMPISREGAQAVTLPDGRIAVLGGAIGCELSHLCSTGTVYSRVDVYTPATNAWSALASMTSPRYRFAAVLYQGQIYALGGSNGTQTVTSTEVYSPGSNSWSAGPNLPQPTEGAAAVVDAGGRIDLVGGFTTNPSQGVYNTLYTSNGSGWTAGPALPQATEDASAVLSPDGRVYVLGGFGGYTPQADYLAAVQVYNPPSAQWAQVTPLPLPLCCSGAVALANGQLLAVGGYALDSAPRTQVAIGTLTAGLAGNIPWHPHQSVRLSDHLSAQIDLADGHVDVHVDDLSLPGRGPDLALDHTWDSTRAQDSASTNAGQGWSTDLTPSMGGVLTDTVTYTHSSGTAWFFPYTGLITATAPYTNYGIPPGQPWQLTATPTGTTGYTLTNILTGAVLRFDTGGRYLSATDAYANSNTLSYGASGPISETNSGGRALSLSYTAGGLLNDVQSPLWRSSAGAQGQHVTYGYTTTNQLRTMTWGAGTTDALTATFGYQGQQLVTITTPYTQSPHTWTLAYDPFGRLSSLTSPISGTPGQAGYTPAYTTQVLYTPGMTQTQLIAGYGTSGALTTTYTLDAQGQATQVQDGMGHGTTSSYDADHDVLASTDANGNQTTNAYQYVGPTGSTGLVTQTVQPKIQAYSPLNGTLDSPTTRHIYNANNDLIETDLPEGGTELFGYDTHHGVITTTQTTAISTTWRGSVNQLDASGELTGVVDGRGVSVNSSGVATLAANAGSYTRHLSYTSSGDLASASTPPITTTLGGVTTASTPVTTTYGYDGDGDQTSVTSANAKTTTSGYDHLGRPVTTTLPTVTLYTGANAAPVQTTGYDGEGNAVRQVDGTGAVTGSSYDPLGRAVATTNAVGATTLITYSATQKVAEQDAMGNVTAYSYGYNALGWTTGVTSTLNGVTTPQTITHDALGRVSGVQSGSSTQSFGYDGNGNLTQAVTNGSTTTYPYNNSIAPNEVQTVSTAGQPTSSYAYDQNGETTSISNTSTISTGLSYDRQARLVGVTLKDGTSVSLSYNSAGQRASYVVSKPGQPTLSERFQYRGDELGQAVVLTGTTTFTDTYVYNPGGLPLELLRQQGGTTSRYWYVLDGRGNVVALTDTTGNVVNRYAYDVWGAPTSVSESVPQRLRYAGYWYDQELSWYGVGMRLYDPSLKRWLQPDPSQQDGVRTYVYVDDDPIDEADSAGFGGVCDWGWFGHTLCGIGTGLGALAQGAYQFVVGADLDTLRSAHASGAEKFLAIVDLSSNALTLVPVFGEGVELTKLAVKAGFEVGSKIATRELSYDEARNLAEQLLKKGVTSAGEACALCFPAGTLVATAHGLQAIQTLHVGQRVLAENPKTGKVEAEPIEAVITDPVSALMAVHLSDGSAITVTADHPFWVDGGPGRHGPRWLPAGQLRRGD